MSGDHDYPSLTRSAAERLAPRDPGPVHPGVRFGGFVKQAIALGFFQSGLRLLCDDPKRGRVVHGEMSGEPKK